MHTIEAALYVRNLQTAWLLAGDWSLDHQERLAELVVERFIRPQPELPCSTPLFPSNSTYPTGVHA